MLAHARTEDSPASSQKSGAHHEGDGSINFPSDALFVNLKYNPRAVRKDGLVVHILNW